MSFDGQTSRDSYGGGKNTNYPVTGPPAVGIDLTNDHPVGVGYPDSGRYAEKTILWGDQSGIDAGPGKYLPLYTNPTTAEDQVECATCHAVHDTDNDYFLRFSNEGSFMCYACHAQW